MEARQKLGLLPAIVEVIMVHLPLADLRVCRQVSQLWRDLSEKEVRRRKYFAPFFQANYCFHHRTYHSSYMDCLSMETFDPINPALDGKIENLDMSSAQACIVFATEDYVQYYKTTPLMRRLYYGREVDESRKEEIQRTIKMNLPQESSLQFFVADGIIGWSADETPFQIVHGYGISLIILPKAPGLKIYSCSREDVYKSNEGDYSLLKKIPNGEDVKCLLIFPDYDVPLSTYHDFVQVCQARQHTKIAVGGVVEGKNFRSGLNIVGIAVDCRSILVSRFETVNGEADSDVDYLKIIKDLDGSDSEEDWDTESEEADSDSDTDSETESEEVISDSDTDSDSDSDTESIKANVRRAMDSYGVLAICGEKVEAASVITYSADSEETVKFKLSKFQKIGYGRNSIAFIFRYYSCDTSNVEKCKNVTSIFHELYPTVPVIGAFGRAIIGTNTFSDDPEEPLYVTETSGPDAIDETVFVFVAIEV